MSKALELRKQRARQLDAAKALCDAAEKEDRDLTPNEQAEVDRFMAEAERLTDDIERSEQSERRVHSVNARLAERKPIPRVLAGIPGLSQAPGTNTSTATGPSEHGPMVGATFDRLFYGTDNAHLDDGGFNSFGDFSRTVATNPTDPRFGQIRAAMGENVPASGGFLTPPAYAKEILGPPMIESAVLPGATTWPMPGRELIIPASDNADQSGEMYDGWAHEWINENTAFTESQPSLRAIKLQAWKSGLLTGVSDELVSDCNGFEVWLKGAAQNATTWVLDKYFLNGSGAGQPLGILNDPALVSVSKEAAQLADTVEYANLAKMFARLHPGCHKRAVWLTNPTTIPQLLQITVAIGTGGVSYPVLREDEGEFYIFGKRVILSEHMPTLGDANDIVLCDRSQYQVGLRQEVTFERSADYAFNKHMTFYRVVARLDGQGAWSSAITPPNGDTLSWVVGLAERA